MLLLSAELDFITPTPMNAIDYAFPDWTKSYMSVGTMLGDA